MTARRYALVWGDVLLQFACFSDAESEVGFRQAHADCTLIETEDFGSPATHYVVDGAVVPIPPPPTPTSHWIPAQREYVELEALAAQAGPTTSTTPETTTTTQSNP